MPYIIMKRNDIPAGTLQVLDLVPNESLRNLIYEPVGQTKYVNAVENDTVVLTGAGPIIFHTEARGLAAWIITNVNDGTGAAASGTFTVAFATPILPGDTVSVGPYLFTAVPGPRTPGANDFSLAGAADIPIAADLAAAINDTANHGGALAALVTASSGGTATVTITADADGVAGNLALATSNGAGFTPVGMAGGVDANALTAADANASADAILALYAYGDLTAAAGTLTLGDINGAMVTGAITAAQLLDVLDVLSGRRYYVPRGVQVDSDGTTFDVQPPVGADGGPGFIAQSNRMVFRTGALNISFADGHLEGFGDSDFVYAGVAGNPNGEAVVVYNDDGTLFTPGL